MNQFRHHQNQVMGILLSMFDLDDKDDILLRDIMSVYDGKFLELSAVAGDTVQLSGQYDSHSIIVVQYQTSHLYNTRFSVRVKQKFYMNDECEYAHLYSIGDIPKISKIYMCDVDTKEKKLIYEL